jgi:riboflavin kinase/FMN adenylyltransferase
MTALEELASVASPGETVVAIGVFDGVHRGHQALLGRLKAEARAQGRFSLVLTFRNHPLTVLQPHAKVLYLSRFEERRRLLDESGVDLVVSLDFDLEVSKLKEREFVTTLIRGLGMRGLVAGPDFALGHQRQGALSVLARLGEELGFGVHVMEFAAVDDVIPSSSAIREALTHGDVTRAGMMLGRPFALEGRVVRGEQRGHGLGFPTVNLDFGEGMALPTDGIYATWVCRGPKRYLGTTCIGKRPTFGFHTRTVETFVMDFRGDLYGEDLRLEFARYLRPEHRFDSEEALKVQMGLDVAQSKLSLDAERWLIDQSSQR